MVAQKQMVDGGGVFSNLVGQTRGKPSFVDGLMLMDDDNKQSHLRKTKMIVQNLHDQNLIHQINLVIMVKMVVESSDSGAYHDENEIELTFSTDRVEAWELLKDQGAGVFAATQQKKLFVIVAHETLRVFSDRLVTYAQRER